MATTETTEAPAKRPRGRPRKDAEKQKMIEGTEPPCYPAIDEAAGEYVEARDARMEMTKAEKEKHDALLKAMTDNGLTEYKYDGKVVLVKPTKIKVKVRKLDAAKDGGSEWGEDPTDDEDDEDEE